MLFDKHSVYIETTFSECLVHPNIILFIKLSTICYVLYILYTKHSDRGKLLRYLFLISSLDDKIFIEKLRLFLSFVVSRH